MVPVLDAFLANSLTISIKTIDRQIVKSNFCEILNLKKMTTFVFKTEITIKIYKNGIRNHGRKL
ncbi:MAG: hypothetical protein ACJA2L_000902 [Polaribacter sp.]|jgi:hypothetical protein